MRELQPELAPVRDSARRAQKVLETATADRASQNFWPRTLCGSEPRVETLTAGAPLGILRLNATRGGYGSFYNGDTLKPLSDVVLYNPHQRGITPAYHADDPCLQHPELAFGVCGTNFFALCDDNRYKFCIMFSANRWSTLLTVLVSVITSAVTTWVLAQYSVIPRVMNVTAPTKHPATDPENAHYARDDSGVELNRDRVMQQLEAAAWCPDDPTKPSSIVGVTDEQVQAQDTAASLEFCRQALQIINSSKVDAHNWFGLGRIALLHGDVKMAEKCLTNAASMNSGIAYYYMADERLTPKAEDQWNTLKTAERLGYTPAREARVKLEQKIVSIIEEYTADPFDPDLPKEKKVWGISDARLMALDTAFVDSMITNYGFLVVQDNASSRLAYGLGRAAYLHQMYDTALKYLSHAAEKHSAPANAMLAYPELTFPLEKQIAHLQIAVQGNYRPAVRRLKDALYMRDAISKAAPRQ